MKINTEKPETTTTLNLHIKQGQNICTTANKTSDIDRKYCKGRLKDNKSKFENTEVKNSRKKTICFKDVVIFYCNSKQLWNVLANRHGQETQEE